jgi:hypothetical protein
VFAEGRLSGSKARPNLRVKDPSHDDRSTDRQFGFWIVHATRRFGGRGPSSVSRVLPRGRWPAAGDGATRPRASRRSRCAGGVEWNAHRGDGLGIRHCSGA